MQAVNQLSQPSGSTRKTKSTSKTHSGAVVTIVAYLIIAISLVSVSFADNGFLLKETITAMSVIGLLLVMKFLGKDALEETSKKF